MKLLLEEDGDRDERTAAFAAAVHAFHGDIAELLLMAGADASQCAPDELLSLREAVESGSPALVDALLDSSIRGRYPASELMEMRSLARRWHEAGAEAELRLRTGSPCDPVRTMVQDDEYYTVGELTLGGVTVRDGHGAILTGLEEVLGVRASCEELITRALDRDQNHTAWGRSAIVLSHRREQETWAAAETLRADADPSRRLFAAELMRLFELFADSHDEEFRVLAVAALTDWSAEEMDSTVLAAVLNGLYSNAGPRAEAALLAHVGHHDVEVRQAVAAGLGTYLDSTHLSDEAREALLTLMSDPDTDVRIVACCSAGEARDPALTDAMAALLDEPERRVQLVAVYGLALHNDERCVEGADRLGQPRPGFRSEEMACLDVAWRYQWRRDDS
ncbi:HEAT repeat domain-containing protein [Streptomyces parvulus]|uniref:HEAT repeat domain-containing protein n=1 Tax=Streptomyces parvulus TaxID=146923 RepID=UPI0036FCF885